MMCRNDKSGVRPRWKYDTHKLKKLAVCKAILLNITNKYRHTHKAKPKLMKWIYTGVVRPKLTYACLIWGKKIKTKVIQQNLNTLNRLACLLTTNLTRTTPQISLEIILNIGKYTRLSYMVYRPQ